jgi:hypothetical protein
VQTEQVGLHVRDLLRQTEASQLLRCKATLSIRPNTNPHSVLAQREGE